MNLRPGRLGFNPYRRSVYNKIHASGIETADPNAEYARCHAAVRSVTLPVSLRSLGLISVRSAANELWAAGVRPRELKPSILLPADTQEEELRHLIDTLCSASSEEHITIGPGHIEITDAVRRPVISGSISGNRFIIPSVYSSDRHRYLPGSSIVMTKWAGMEASFLLAAEREEELSRRFPVSIINRMKKMSDALSIAVESAAAAMSGVQMMLALSEGGVYTALWDLALAAGTGLSVNLEQIPILQETIELSNYYDIDPYQMSSEGSLLLIFEPNGFLADSDTSARQYIKKLAEKGITASLIGHLTDSHDKIIQNGEDIRYLDRPQPDELLKILQ